MDRSHRKDGNFLTTTTMVADPVPGIMVGSGIGLNTKFEKPSEIELFFQYLLTKVMIQY